MLKYHKKTRLFADPTVSSRARRRYRELAGRVFILSEPFICFYAVCGALLFAARFLVSGDRYRKALFITMAVLALLMTGALLLCGFIGRRQEEERQYIERLVFLFCKYQDFRMAVREMQVLFRGREMRRTLNRALYIIDRGSSVQQAMEIVERRLADRRVALLHRYILESGNIKNYRPPAEILTGLLTRESVSKRPPRLIRFDRLRLIFCSVVSFGICLALRCFAARYGFDNADIPQDLLVIAAFVVLAVIFFVFELKNTDSMPQEEVADQKALICTWLRELVVLLLVRPVRGAVTISASYADRRIKRKISRFAADIAKGAVTPGIFLKIVEDCEDSRIARIMEFLYAKAGEKFLAPSELVPMIRLLDEQESERTACLALEAKRRRQGLLLAPQAASLVMVFGSFFTLFTNLWREL